VALHGLERFRARVEKAGLERRERRKGCFWGAAHGRTVSASQAMEWKVVPHWERTKDRELFYTT